MVRRVFQFLIYAFLIAAFVYAIYINRDQLAAIIDVLEDGIWYLVLAALLVLGLAIYNQSLLYAHIYRLLDIPSRRREFVPLYLVRRFVQVAAPSGGFSGWAPFIRFAHRRNISVGAVFTANLIYTILWYSTFGIFLLLGLFVLFATNKLQWFETSAALVIAAVDLIMIGLVVAAWVKPEWPEQIMRWISYALQWVFSWIGRRPPLSRYQLTTFATDLTEGIVKMRQAGWRRLLMPVGHAFLNEAFNLVMLFMIALAFGIELSFGVSAAAYGINILFWIVSPTPGGLGFVEGAVILVLTQLNVPASAASVITLAYRGITFWVPFILGFAALRWSRRSPAEIVAGVERE